MAVVPYFLLLWTFLAPFSHAELSCPNPPSSADVFLDMTQLHFVAIQNPGLLQAPKRCSTADREVTCKNQVCCLNEVGCCYADPKTRGNRCGCRRVEDVECTMTAPLAVVRNSVCESHKKAAVTACLRNKAVEGTHGWLPRISHDSKLTPEKEQSDGYFENEVDFGVLTVAASADYSFNDDAGRVALDSFTAEQLEEKLKPGVLSKLIELVERKKKIGLPFGLQES